MIETLVKDYLKQKLKLPCVMEYPENPPDEFIVIEKTGSGYENHLNNATLAIQSYGASMYKAAALNERAVKAMIDMAEQKEICKVSLNSDYNFTDTSQKKYRYQAVFDIKYY